MWRTTTRRLVRARRVVETVEIPNGEFMITLTSALVNTKPPANFGYDNAGTKKIRNNIVTSGRFRKMTPSLTARFQNPYFRRPFERMATSHIGSTRVLSSSRWLNAKRRKDACSAKMLQVMRPSQASGMHHLVNNTHTSGMHHLVNNVHTSQDGDIMMCL